ncbi:MAG: hypothetical protein U1D35_11250 [Paracoccaceae bacterium]|nr:hypothetical protein [Paracoccaceae bacterium]
MTAEKTPEETTDRLLSTDDARASNSGVRHTYRVLNDAEKAQMQEIKDFGRDFLVILNDLGSSREISIARTRIEEAVMWAVRHVTA